MHTGRMILRNSPPSGCIGVSAFFRVLPVPTKPGACQHCPFVPSD